jgi:hypothetical protein
VCPSEGRTHSEGVRDRGAEGGIWVKGDEVTGKWRKLHNKELYALYCSPYITWVIKSRRIRWAGNVARVGDRRCAYRVFVGRREGKRPLGRPRCRWENNIKMDLQEVGWDMAWIDLAQDSDRWRALGNIVTNLRAAQTAGNFLTG